MTVKLKMLATTLAFSTLLAVGCSPSGTKNSDLNNSSSADTGTGTGPVQDPTSTNSGKIYGVTVDSVTNTADIVASLQKLNHKATTRIVFDEGQPASAYSAATQQIHNASFVMGEILDSFYVKNITTA